MSLLHIQTNAKFLRKLNAYLTLFWLLNFPPVIILYVIFPSEKFQAFCLLYLALVSIWANVAGHASAWQGARTEVKQDKANDDS